MARGCVSCGSLRARFGVAKGWPSRNSDADGRTTLFDVAANRLRDVTTPALTNPRALEWSRLGLIAWADLSSGIRGWSDRSGETLESGDDWGITDSLAFHPAGQWLATEGDSSMHPWHSRRRIRGWLSQGTAKRQSGMLTPAES